MFQGKNLKPHFHNRQAGFTRRILSYRSTKPYPEVYPCPLSVHKAPSGKVHLIRQKVHSSEMKKRKSKKNNKTLFQGGDQIKPLALHSWWSSVPWENSLISHYGHVCLCLKAQGSQKAGSASRHVCDLCTHTAASVHTQAVLLVHQKHKERKIQDVVTVQTKLKGRDESS